MNTKMNEKCKVVALAIQKGGVAKTTSSVAMSAALAKLGYKVLLIDNDPQANSSRSLGRYDKTGQSISIYNIMDDMLNYKLIENSKGIVETDENFDLLPSNDSYASTELHLISKMNREYFMRQYIDLIRDDYDYILIDCPPNLGMLTINALVAADEILIPSQAQDYSATSIEQVLRTVQMIQRFPNQNLKIGGIFLTMFDPRRREDNFIKKGIEKGFSGCKLFEQTIPSSVRVPEASRKHLSIISYEPNGKVATAYKRLTEEVFINGSK